MLRSLILLPPTPAPATFRGPRDNDDEHRREHCHDTRITDPGPWKQQARHAQERQIAEQQRPALPADREARAIAVALGRKPVAVLAHSFGSFGGRPRLRGAGAFSFTPRLASASRSRHSTCALTLLKSAAAQRSTAAHSAGSTRSG